MVEGVGDVDQASARREADGVLELGGRARPVAVPETEEVARPADRPDPGPALQVRDRPDAGSLGVGDVQHAVHQGQAARLGEPGLPGVAVPAPLDAGPGKGEGLGRSRVVYPDLVAARVGDEEAAPIPGETPG